MVFNPLSALFMVCCGREDKSAMGKEILFRWGIPPCFALSFVGASVKQLSHYRICIITVGTLWKMAALQFPWQSCIWKIYGSLNEISFLLHHCFPLSFPWSALVWPWLVSRWETTKEYRGRYAKPGNGKQPLSPWKPYGMWLDGENNNKDSPLHPEHACLAMLLLRSVIFRLDPVIWQWKSMVVTDLALCSLLSGC